MVDLPWPGGGQGFLLASGKGAKHFFGAVRGDGPFFLPAGCRFYKRQPRNKCNLPQRACGHTGWVVNSGKIIEGMEPPAEILPFSKGGFSVSGREGSAAAPNGKVYYINKEVGLEAGFPLRHYKFSNSQFYNLAILACFTIKNFQGS